MSEAYRLAGYVPNNGHASRLASNGSIAARIAEILEEKGITSDHVRNEVSRIAFGSPADVLDIHELRTNKKIIIKDDADLSLIQSIKISDKFGTEVRFFNKQSALELLAKVLGMLTNKHELTGKDGGPIETNPQVVFYIPGNGRDDKPDDSN